MQPFRPLSRLGVLAMTAFVAGCGGGGGGDGSTTATSASSPAAGETDITVSTVSTQATRAKLPVLSLAFTAPADQEVLNVGTAAAVTVRLKIDGAAAIDGTVVRFGGTRSINHALESHLMT